MFLASTVLLALAHDHLWQLLLAMALGGVGSGFTFSSLAVLMVPHVPQAETGSAMAFNQVLRYLGFTIGSALSVALMAAYGGGEPRLPRHPADRVVDLRGRRDRCRRARPPTARALRFGPRGPEPSSGREHLSRTHVPLSPPAPSWRSPAAATPPPPSTSPSSRTRSRRSSRPRSAPRRTTSRARTTWRARRARDALHPDRRRGRARRDRDGHQRRRQAGELRRRGRRDGRAAGRRRDHAAAGLRALPPGPAGGRGHAVRRARRPTPAST